MRGVGRFRKFLLVFVTSILVANPLFVCDVSAATLAEDCVSAELFGDNLRLSTSFSVSIECGGPISFVDPENSVIVSKIFLNGVTPTSAGIDGSKLNIFFSYLDFSAYKNNSLTNRNLVIGSGVIIGADSIQNTEILLNTAQIIDKATPFANDNRYLISGNSLSVTALNGILKDDYEFEGSMNDVIVDVPPTKGTASVNDDGLFTYSYDTGQYGDDQFTYSVVDDSGNISNSAIVRIFDGVLEITAIFYNNNAQTSKYAKPGDKLVLNFSTDGPSTIDSIQICGQTIIDYTNSNNTTYSASYVMLESDDEKLCKPSVSLHDNSGSASYNPEVGITFDKTKPIIELQYGSEVNFSIHDASVDYSTFRVSAYDVISAAGRKEYLQVYTTGFVDFDKVGTYEITYIAIDRAGNVTEARRIFNIQDEVNQQYAQISSDLSVFGINSNLSEITIDNYESFNGLYFEKSFDNKKVGRITFLGPLDISTNEGIFINFFPYLDDFFLADNFGEIGMDLSEITDQSVLLNGGAEVKFYNLNELGYSSGSKVADILSSMIIYDDSGNIIDNGDILSVGNFVGCSTTSPNCYTFSIKVNHFSKYVISNDTVAPTVSIDKIKNYQIGETIIISGLIDDSDAKLIINIDGKDFEVPQVNIKNGKWFFEINLNNMSIGRHVVGISATDFGLNKSTESTEMFIIKKAMPTPSSVLESIITQPAAIIADSPKSILGDKIKGDTKSTATVINADSDLKLDKQELGLIFIVILLGITILAVDRKRK